MNTFESRYESVDKLQRVLVEDVFHYAQDSKKAAGRALGTIVEVITFYLLKNWGLSDSISIERGLQEYGNPEITHNVEYSLHPVLNQDSVTIEKKGKSITANSILSSLAASHLRVEGMDRKSNVLLTRDLILRNACTVGSVGENYLLASLNQFSGDKAEVKLYLQHQKPYAIFECKRVGVEEGIKKGPQTIEKAKQGAYVANAVSSLQKIRTESGELQGIIFNSNNIPYSKPYDELLEEVISSSDPELLRKFILTVGVVSNHGNWFTSENQNKELKVLAQSYDWLLFLTDRGLSQFIENLILHPEPRFEPVKRAFLASYPKGKGKNQFTKVQMNWEANVVLDEYFQNNLPVIESWFNVISPDNKSISTLKEELKELKSKDWKNILK
ncbi:MAG: hypothetical protein H6577_17205 [Lewinellaceae bacterium]|nr:hypothetical protein [Saprospiraceae bacterium]MCB9339866.1 hypothetical protein [Lewinellaceae bacterium]